MADKIFGRITAALETLALEQHSQLAPIAEWVDDTSRFVERIAALDAADVAPEHAQIIQQLLSNAAQIIVAAQQDVLKHTLGAAIAIEQQKRLSKRVVKARAMPGRPAQLVRP